MKDPKPRARTKVLVALAAAGTLSACGPHRDKGADMAACRLQADVRPSANRVYASIDEQIWSEETALANYLVECMRSKSWVFTTQICPLRYTNGDIADKANEAARYAAFAREAGCYELVIQDDPGLLGRIEGFFR